MSVDVRPWWVGPVLAASKTPVSSGVATVGGNVQAAPQTLANAAGVSLDQYTLARNISSEIGSGTPEMQMLVALAAINRARLRGQTVSTLLLTAKPGHAGYYGPIHGPEGVTTAPYGRWASTSRDPTRRNLKVAALALSGAANGFTAADDQYGPKYNLPNAIKLIPWRAAKGNYWVGHLPNVDPHDVMGFQHLPQLAPSSPEGQARIAAAVQMLQSPGVYPRPTEIASQWGALFPLAALYGLWRWWKR